MDALKAAGCNKRSDLGCHVTDMRDTTAVIDADHPVAGIVEGPSVSVGTANA